MNEKQTVSAIALLILAVAPGAKSVGAFPKKIETNKLKQEIYQ